MVKGIFNQRQTQGDSLLLVAHPISLSLVTSSRDNRPQRADWSLGQFVTHFSSHRERASKDGPAFIPAVFRENTTRASANVKCVTALVLDVDDGTPYDELLPKLETFAHFFHTSYSHTNEHPKYRIIVFLEQPIPSEDWPQFWQRAARYFGHMDPATKDLARLYYLPAHPTGRSDFACHFHEGRLLNVEDLPELEVSTTCGQRSLDRAEGRDHRPAHLSLVELGIETDDSLQPKQGLPEVVRRCAFMQYASTPDNQPDLSEPLWMAMITNACVFEGSEAWIHAASEEHEEYSEEETQKRIERYRETCAPTTCRHIQELGFTGCPSEGCQTRRGDVTGAPAGLWAWAFGNQGAQGCAAEEDVQIGNFTISNRGVFHTQENGDKPPIVTVVSHTRIDVLALTRDGDGHSWGVLLKISDRDGNSKKWAMPSEMLATPGVPYRQRLMEMGAAIGTDKQAVDLLARYLSSAAPNERVLCVTQLGWHGAHFVLPDACYGPATGEEVVFQGGTSERVISFDQAGTAEGWRQGVGSIAIGNSRIALALALALTGPVLPLLNEEAFGVNLRGPSSIGKTLALKAGATVWSTHHFINTWNATGNAIQSVASMHNHTFLALDEMGEADPSSIGSTVFALANGQGRLRANQTGDHRNARRWKMPFMSTSERSLAAVMNEAGRQVLAGQEVRLIEIPADAGAGFGIFDCLQGEETSREMAVRLQRSIEENAGHAGRAWAQLLADPERQPELLRRIREHANRFSAQLAQSGDAGQVSRVISRMALIAAVGEVCSEEGILPWPRQTASNAVRQCLNAWIEQRGGRGELEREQATSAVREFLMRHGNSRFENKYSKGIGETQRIPNRAGFIEGRNDDEQIFFIASDVYNSEVCRGLDPKLVTRALADAGYLKKDAHGRNQRKRRDGTGNTAYFYAVSSAILRLNEVSIEEEGNEDGNTPCRAVTS